MKGAVEADLKRVLTSRDGVLVSLLTKELKMEPEKGAGRR